MISALVTNVHQGRVITRLVSLFDTVDSLVEESDRRHCLVADMLADDLPTPQESDHTEECAFFLDRDNKLKFQTLANIALSAAISSSPNTSPP